MKPKHLLQRRIICISLRDTLKEMCDRDRKIARDDFGNKRKSTGFIYVPGS